MKKGINLIIKQKKYLRYENFFRALRVILLGLTIFFSITLISLFAFLFIKNRQLEQLMLEKKNLLNFLSKNKEVEAEFAYFHNKQNRLITILNQDVKFLPYYNLITDSLKSASPEPKLDTIIINKDRSINFTLIFNDANSVIPFLKFAESDQFVNNFSQLIISEFSITSEKDSQSYQLGLVGKLNPIDETKD